MAPQIALIIIIIIQTFVFVKYRKSVESRQVLSVSNLRKVGLNEIVDGIPKGTAKLNVSERQLWNEKFSDSIQTP